MCSEYHTAHTFTLCRTKHVKSIYDHIHMKHMTDVIHIFIHITNALIAASGRRHAFDVSIRHSTYVTVVLVHCFTARSTPTISM